jgi:hypothetical protein
MLVPPLYPHTYSAAPALIIPRARSTLTGGIRTPTYGDFPEPVRDHARAFQIMIGSSFAWNNTPLLLMFVAI